MAPATSMASHPPVSASQAAVDSFVITQLLDNGMDVVARRINHLQKKIQQHENDPQLQRKCARQLQHWLVVACRLLRQHRSQLTHCIDTLEADLKSGALPVFSEADTSSASSINGTPRPSRADSIQSPPLSAIVMPGPNEPLVPSGGYVAAKVARSHELWILARIVAFHAATDSYEVEDVDTSEDDGTRRHHLVPRHQVVEMVADRLPEHEWIQYGVNQRVMAMYPNTTSFFRATIQVPNPKVKHCHICRFPWQRPHSDAMV